MENTTFAMPNIIDSHDMGLRTVLQSRRPKENAYSTPIERWTSRMRCQSVFRPTENLRPGKSALLKVETISKNTAHCLVYLYTCLCLIKL
ncbi:hypothetical protein TNCV_3570431 [Trichonephila clavipes]|nr:hypothetical protein TNCV_3570431 [Trichonephila clavipes]